MKKSQKNCYVVSVDDEFGFPISRAEYVGSDLGFRVWYAQLRRNFTELRHGQKLNFPFYFYPVTEG